MEISNNKPCTVIINIYSGMWLHFILRKQRLKNLPLPSSYFCQILASNFLRIFFLLLLWKNPQSWITFVSCFDLQQEMKQLYKHISNAKRVENNLIQIFFDTIHTVLWLTNALALNIIIWLEIDNLIPKYRTVESEKYRTARPVPKFSYTSLLENI